MALAAIGRPATALVVGASGGIGGALLAQLRAAGLDAAGTARGAASGLRHLDVTDEASIIATCADIHESQPPLRVVVVASGFLHQGTHRPEKGWRDLNAERLARSFAVNAIGPALVAKHALAMMPREGRCLFAALSARVGSIADNALGGWYGYRASKAALNQMIRTLAIEARRTHPDAIVVALHPGTVATALSAPFRGQARNVVSPEVAATRLLAVLDGLTPEDSGGFFAWDGAPVPF